LARDRLVLVQQVHIFRVHAAVGQLLQRHALGYV
jgi:hypothetical protein